MPKPTEGTYPAYFKGYIDQVPENDLFEAFASQQQVMDYFIDISEEQSLISYAPGKWTLKEMLQHIIDAERIFNYRALCFARNEQGSLPGFDEDAYAANSDANKRSWKSLLDEIQIVRKGTEMLFNSFTPEMLQQSGLANNNPVSVSAIGFIAVGHLYHHKKIIETRYLPQVTF